MKKTVLAPVVIAIALLIGMYLVVTNILRTNTFHIQLANAWLGKSKEHFATWEKKGDVVYCTIDILQSKFDDGKVATSYGYAISGNSVFVQVSHFGPEFTRTVIANDYNLDGIVDLGYEMKNPNSGDLGTQDSSKSNDFYQKDFNEAIALLPK